jgi:glycine cleavage system H protein
MRTGQGRKTSMQYGNTDIPEDLNYTRSHLWVAIKDGVFTLGWTDYIQSNAGDVNYVELPQKGTLVELDDDFGSIETSKWVDRLYSPIKGEVVGVNDRVINQPDLINKAPYVEGWFIRIKPNGETGAQNLMSATEYLEYIKACEGEISRSN